LVVKKIEEKKMKKITTMSEKKIMKYYDVVSKVSIFVIVSIGTGVIF